MLMSNVQRLGHYAKLDLQISRMGPGSRISNVGEASAIETTRAQSGYTRAAASGGCILSLCRFQPGAACEGGA